MSWLPGALRDAACAQARRAPGTALRPRRETRTPSAPPYPQWYEATSSSRAESRSAYLAGVRSEGVEKTLWRAARTRGRRWRSRYYVEPSVGSTARQSALFGGRSRTSVRYAGQGTRFFWIDPLPGGVLGIPPFAARAAYPCQTTNKIRGAADYGFGFSAYPSREPDTPYEPLPRVNRSRPPATASWRRPIQYSGLLKNYALPNKVSAGVFQLQKRKNPGDAFRRHQPGFSVFLGRCLGCSSPPGT